MNTPDPTEYLMARYAEDEEAALAAISPDRPGTHWQWVRESDDAVVKDPADDEADEWPYGLRTAEEFPAPAALLSLPAYILRGVFPSESLGHRHIARHDPARVLADVAAKRAVVRQHCDTDGHCDLCCHTLSGEPEFYEYPCPTLYALLQPYADRGDFPDEWRTSE